MSVSLSSSDERTLPSLLDDLGRLLFGLEQRLDSSRVLSGLDVSVAPLACDGLPLWMSRVGTV